MNNTWLQHTVSIVNLGLYHHKTQPAFRTSVFEKSNFEMRFKKVDAYVRSCYLNGCQRGRAGALGIEQIDPAPTYPTVK